LVTAKGRSRTAILALACLGHAVLIVLLARGVDGARYPVLAREPEPLRLVLMDNLTRPETTSARMPAPELIPPSDAIRIINHTRCQSGFAIEKEYVATGSSKNDLFSEAFTWNM